MGYSYRVAEKIWAEAYPVNDWDIGARRSPVRLFLDYGITDFFDLSEYGEMPRYADFLPEGVGRYTSPISNGGAPESVGSIAEMFRSLNQLFSEHTVVICIFIVMERLVVACYYM